MKAGDFFAKQKDNTHTAIMRYTKLLTCLAIIIGLAACKEEEKQQDLTLSKEEMTKDSLALHVAVFPCEGALPLYYAEAKGLLQEEADIRLVHLSTMEDCDTALTQGHAEIALTDMGRAICMRKDGYRATILAQVYGSIGLYTHQTTRINEVKQLKERIVALDRHSESDYYSDQLAEGARLERLDIFRTQFNNHKLREEMLSNKLVDGAFLDEPYGTLAIEHGAKCIWSRSDKDASWNVLASPTKMLKDKRRMEQAASLIHAYEKAVEALQDTTKNEMQDLLKQYYAIPNAEIDTLASIQVSVKPQPLKLPKADNIEMARNWLVKRGWISNQLPTDSISSNMLFK